VANVVSARAPAWADGIAVSGAEMRAAIGGAMYASAGLVRGLRPVQIPTPAMKIRVPAGLSIVADSQLGMVPLELAAQTDLDIATSSPTQPRIDSLVAEFVDNGASSLYRYRILTGTPAASPSAPTLPPGDQPTASTLRIANVAVGANVTTILDGNISLQTGLAVMASYGRVPSIGSDGARPAVFAPSEARWRTDKLCFDVAPTSSSWAELYLTAGGPAWTAYTPNLTASTTNPTLGTGSIREGAWTRYGRLMVVRANVKFGTSGASAGSGSYRISLPATAKTLTTGRHIGSAYAFDASGNNFIDGVSISTIDTWNEANLVLDGNVVTNTWPWTWTNLDAFGFTLLLEAAS
jgi:hypothetical protein